MLDNSDRQDVYALYKDTCLSCFEIPNLSVLFVAFLGALGWKFKRLYLANQQVCTLLHTAGISSFIKSKQVLKSCQQFCRVESLVSEEHGIWLHFLQFSLEPVCKDLNGTLFKSSKHEVLFSSTKLVVNMSIFCCLATNTVKMYNQTSFNSCKTEIGL